MECKSQKLDVVVIGGGLVGSLVACFLAKRDHQVRVYEYRPDTRIKESLGVSIELALSNRGRLALKAIGLEDALIVQHGSAMKSRMLHLKDGSLKKIVYDPVKNNCIYAVNRNYLNRLLLNAADKNVNVTLNFNRKLVDANFETGKLTFMNTITKEIEVTYAEFIIGADGAYSTLRRLMIKTPLFNFEQKYIEHGYVEVSFPSPESNEYILERNHLHVWPRGNFMMIALPNDDGSFTGNIFAPFSTFDSLDTPDRLMQFFNEQFPDAISVIDKNNLIESFFETKPQTLISVKCSPYHVGSRCLIIGDAAHAMVPFYAMGMNTGFEDVLLLDELMQLYSCDMEVILAQFSAIRCKDAHAICDLAMYNYVEMRDLVTKKSFIARKHLDTFLHWLLPDIWIPLYFTVHFSRMSFRECILNKSWQDKVIRNVILSIAVITAAIIIFTLL